MAKINKRNMSLHSISSKISAQFDNSVIYRFFGSVSNYVLSLRSRFIGAFFMSLGIYAIVESLVKYLIFSTDFSDSFYMGIVSVLSSIPLMNSELNLAGLISNSRVGHYLSKYIDIRSERLKVSYHNGVTAIGFLVGAFCGFLSIRYSIVVICTICIVALIIKYPMVGYMLSITCVLFPVNNYLQYSVLFLTLTAVLLKILRSKALYTLRNFRSMSLCIPLLAYLIVRQINLQDSLSLLIFLIISMLSPSILNKSRKVVNLGRFFSFVVVAYSMYHLVCFVVNYLIKVFNINGFGIEWRKLSIIPDKNTVLIASAFFLLVTVTFSKSRHVSHKLRSVVFSLIVATSGVLCCNINFPSYDSVLNKLTTFDIIPFVLITIHAIFLVVYCIIRYAIIKKYENISLKTSVIFQRYDYVRFLLAFIFVSLAIVSSYIISSNTSLVLYVMIFVNSLLVSYSSIFEIEAIKSVSSVIETQNENNSSVVL